MSNIVLRSLYNSLFWLVRWSVGPLVRPLIRPLVRPLVGLSVPISLRKLITSQFFRAWGLVNTLFNIVFLIIEFTYKILRPFGGWPARRAGGLRPSSSPLNTPSHTGLSTGLWQGVAIWTPYSFTYTLQAGQLQNGLTLVSRVARLQGGHLARPSSSPQDTRCCTPGVTMGESVFAP
jgi:hypothetical protein